MLRNNENTLRKSIADAVRRHGNNSEALTGKIAQVLTWLDTSLAIRQTSKRNPMTGPDFGPAEVSVDQFGLHEGRVVVIYYGAVEH